MDDFRKQSHSWKDKLDAIVHAPGAHDKYNNGKATIRARRSSALAEEQLVMLLLVMASEHD
jgi:hypothetical protein